MGKNIVIGLFIFFCKNVNAMNPAYRMQALRSFPSEIVSTFKEVAVMLKYMVTAGLKKDPVFLTTLLNIVLLKKYQRVAKFLMWYGVSFEWVDNSGDTPLMCAIKNNDFHMLLFLEEQGVDFGKKIDADLPINHAIFCANYKAFEHIVLSGVSINEQDESKMSPLLNAVVRDNSAMATFLIDRGADIAVKNIYNKTPLHFAASFGNEQLVKLLIYKGAPIDQLDQNEMSPLALAVYNNRKSVIPYFLPVLSNAERVKALERADALVGRDDIVVLLSKNFEESIEVKKARAAYLALYAGKSSLVKKLCNREVGLLKK